MDRIVERWQLQQKSRAKRIASRRAALRRIMRRRLRGIAIAPEVTVEMKRHARRLARLRRIRFIAAKAKDYDTVAKTDRLLARQQSQHNQWWRAYTRKNMPAKNRRPR